MHSYTSDEPIWSELLAKAVPAIGGVASFAVIGGVLRLAGVSGTGALSILVPTFTIGATIFLVARSRSSQTPATRPPAVSATRRQRTAS